MSNPDIRNSIWIFCIAFLIRIGYVVLFVEIEYLVIEDQSLYIQLAQEFLVSGFLGVTPERTPGYPLFLSIISNTSNDSLWNVVIIQIILDSVSCVIIALMAKSLFESGFWFAGFLSAFNLNMIVLSASILTDTLFLFFFVLFLFSLIKYLHSENTKWLFLLFLFISLSALVRAVSYYLIPVLLIGLVVWRVWKKDSILKVSKLVVLCLVIVGIFLGGIHQRNYQKYGATEFVSQTGGAMLWWIIPATYQYSGQGSYQEGQILAKKRLRLALQHDNLISLSHNPFEASRYEVDVGKKILMDFGFLNVFKAWASGSVVNILSPIVAFSPALRSMAHNSFYETEGVGVFSKLLNYIKNSENLFYLLVLLIGTITSVLFTLLSLVGVFKSFNTLPPVTTLALLTLVGYFLVVTGPIIGVKYRLPIEPIMTLFFSYSLINFRKYKISLIK